VDAKAAIHAVSSNSQPKSKKINDIKQALKHLKALKKIVIFQWVPSHVGLEGNEIAEKLAKKGTLLHTTDTPLQADTFEPTSWLQKRNGEITTKSGQNTKASLGRKW